MNDKKNWQTTLLLPKTDFAMRANLPTQEPTWLARWEKMGLYNRQRKLQAGKEKFILHDGPPYANGHLHIGHALNKVLKDIIVRSQNMMGKDAPYVPGWDCHGLPIEWKVEENLRAEGKNKNDIPVNAFRKLCRDYATHWLNIQREEFKRLGVLGDWDKPYSTMDYTSEAIIAGEIGKVAEKGLLYRDYRPVMWSIPEQTALAEAEVEYKDITTRAVYVAFPFKRIDKDKNYYENEHLEIVIWTTTPWTLPANHGIAFNKEITYAIYNIKDFNGKVRKVVLAKKLAKQVAEKCKWQNIKEEREVKPESYGGGTNFLEEEVVDCFGNYTNKLSDNINKIIHADFVSDDAGTGFVHIAPHHGKDDYHLFNLIYIDIYETLGAPVISPNGFYSDKIILQIPELQNVRVYDENGKDGGANNAVIAALKRVDALVGVENYKHSYPHSWRSKAPIIFLATSQWFINMDALDYVDTYQWEEKISGKNWLREKSLEALKEVAAYPANGKSALTEMITNRPDWCISRQRAWGVSLPLFINKEDASVIGDKKLFSRVEEIFEKHGADAWFDDAQYPNSFWLKDIVPETDDDKYKKIKDVVDVWFDSGSTHAFVLAQRPEFRNPGQKGDDVIADLYLEGTDQHRGWFHSSLLESVATRGRAPYRALLTHGFVLDEKGNKMSKSLGNVTAPEDVIREHGADILRLWVVASNYTENLTIGKNILTQHSESYRRIRNTFRWLLGVIGTDRGEVKSFKKSELPLLEQYILRRLAQLATDIEKYAKDYEFNKIFLLLYRFCDQDLSAFYFDVRKDSLYCDAKDSPQRKQTMFVIEQIFDCLCKWFAPILCFTAEEAWLAHPKNQGKEDETIHLHQFPTIPEEWRQGNLDEQVEQIMDIRKNVLQVLEIARKDKKIGSGLEATISLTLPKETYTAVEEFDLANIFIVSDVVVQPGDELKIEWQAASGDKCGRCWKILPEVKNDLCQRCEAVVANSN